MKLAQRYNRVNLLTSFIILVITGLIYYFTVHYILTQKLDTDLAIEENEIEAYVKNYGKLPNAGDFLHQKVQYTILNDNSLLKRQFINSDYLDSSEGELEPGRILITPIKVGTQLYRVDISKSRVESEDLAELILLITVIVTLLLLASLLLINRLLLKRIWQPFYHTLNIMKQFNLASKHGIVIEKSNIDEFNELSDVATLMAESVKRDYKELKSFTENASHEMMTPLAVIGAKLDLLLQVESLSDQQGQLVEDIYNSVGKLGRLNQTLILLAKIENKLIPELELVDLKILLSKKASHFNELLSAKNISMVMDLEPKSVLMSDYLVDILLNNLFANAIRHNVDGGKIVISLSESSMIFSNTGIPSALDELFAFERFQKNPTSEGMGLGLAIIKQIVALHQMEITYFYRDELHSFQISF